MMNAPEQQAWSWATGIKYHIGPSLLPQIVAIALGEKRGRG